MSKSVLEERKRDHLELAASGRADFAKRTTLLEQVHLVHQSLPELATEDIDLTTRLCDHPLRAPLVISGMTGGTPEAAQINRDLATAAEEAGIGFGVGSQRAMAEHPELESTFQVRDVAPNVFLMGNIGAVQARDLGAEKVAELARRIGANAMVVHLNPAQELIQENGDRNFRGCIDGIARLVDALPTPIVVKETGCGLSPQVARRLLDIGVSTVDVSGAGGTSWVAVESQRAGDGSAAQALGRELWDWGIPTAVSTAVCARAGLEVIATGGLRCGLDIARALALGARCGGVAAEALRAQRAEGADGVRKLIAGLLRSLRSVSLLTGTRAIAELDRATAHLGPDLRTWLDDLGAR